MASSDPPRRVRRIAFHGIRICLFVAILCLIRWQHDRVNARRDELPRVQVSLERVTPFFPKAESISDKLGGHEGRDVFSKTGYALGYILQTSPESDHVVGFSGPTNVLIAFSTKEADHRIVGIDVLWSRDTREHVRQVLEDDTFLKTFNGMTWEEAAAVEQVDGVSGATLTSLAIAESVIHRMGGGRPSLRFAYPLSTDHVAPVFPHAAAVDQDPKHGSLWHVRDAQGDELGTILRTSPAGDNIIGFAGPTEVLIGFDLDHRVSGICLAKSYDTDPYVGWVREDKYFPKTFHGLSLSELAALDLQEAEVEGVSGATMTSLGVAEAMVAAAVQHQENLSQAESVTEVKSPLRARDIGTLAVVASGIVIAFTRLRSRKSVRVVFRLVLIGYLGLINGDMLSQAMIVGWAQSGIPWQSAIGLVGLTAAALILPVFTRRNLYCSYLCPHGAVQRILVHRLPWRLRLPRRVSMTLTVIPAALLLWCLVVALVPLPYSLVDIEPFDAWLIGIAGWATITVAVVGLVAALFVPMAYCRYGCPTGMLLGYLRFSTRGDRWTLGDWTATALLLVAIGLVFWA
jgi:transcriptional regulator of nitric oxide reductase